MSSYNLVSRIVVGFKRKPFKLFGNIFVAYATFWTVLEPLISIVPNADKYLSGELKFFTLVVISSLFGMYRNAIPAEITVKHSNSTIKIVFGDLFAFDGFKAIPVSRYFFETQVVLTSLQNKIIQMFINSEEGTEGFKAYNQAISAAIKGDNYQEIYRDATQRKEKYYPLGTTVTLELNGQDYILFALTDPLIQFQ
ncbi:MAG: hypothetical protein F6K32_28110 [Desertifilum sp. SIO1I2]|nr:hypothetical protein [Desertifilum sp. SIO1I2]